MIPGDKIHYVAPHEGAVPQNGMFKSLNEFDKTHIFVVFNCGEDWERYKDYTGQNTPISRVFPGWV